MKNKNSNPKKGRILHFPVHKIREESEQQLNCQIHQFPQTPAPGAVLILITVKDHLQVCLDLCIQHRIFERNTLAEILPYILQIEGMLRIFKRKLMESAQM